MAEDSKISWTQNTFNPWVGCCKVSDGCKHCYAEAQMTRKPRWANTWGPEVLTRRVRTSDANWKKPRKWNMEADHAGKYTKVFCASLADVFEDHKQVDPWRKELFQLIDTTSFLAWQLLTKRPENITKMVPPSWLNLWPENVWIGTSVENQEMADKRIPELLRVPAKIRFLSVEPMLSPIYIDVNYNRAPDWVIIGGESGSEHRPVSIDWIESLVDQCQSANVPVFVKQDSGFRPGQRGRIPDHLWLHQFPEYEPLPSTKQDELL